MQKIHFGTSACLLEAMKKSSQESHRHKYGYCPKPALKAKRYFKLETKQNLRTKQKQQNPKPMMPFKEGKTYLVLLVPVWM